MIKTFRCLNCNQYIATNAEQCRFCGVVVDTKAAQIAAEMEEFEIENQQDPRQEKVKRFAKIAGLITLSIGLKFTVIALFFFFIIAIISNLFFKSLFSF